jgi:FkbM family methyltransferase
MKRFFYNLLPNSFKEFSKLQYYNFCNKEYSFALKNNLYITNQSNNWRVATTKPLYFIVKDIDRYEKYYKVKPNDIVIDAGANVGSLTVVYMQKVGPKGKVFAFEPDNINLERLCENILLNNNHKNVETIDRALWESDDKIDFFETGNVASSIFYEVQNSNKINISTTSIDNFMVSKNIKQLNFVKMDIEGAEIEALKGSIKTIKKYRPDFAIASYHILNNQPTYIALENFFKKINYPFKTEFFKDGEIMTYAGDNLK